MTNPTLSGLSDDELVLSVQNEIPGALTELIKRFRPFVEKIASHYFGVSLESDDIVQEGMLALLSAAYSYLPGKSAAFTTYSAVCISNRLRSLVKSEAGKKNSPLNSYVPLDDIEIAADSDPVNKVLADEAAKNLSEMIDSELSAMERKVLSCMIAGMSYKEAGNALGISEKSVNNALQRLRNKLKKAMGKTRS